MVRKGINKDIFSLAGNKHILTSEDRLCSHNGDIAVDDLKTCKEAADELGKPFKITEDKDKPDEMPNGCYLSGEVYFNQNASGSSNYNARQICQPRGKK